MCMDCVWVHTFSSLCVGLCSLTAPWPPAAAGFCVRFSAVWLRSPKERQQRPVRLGFGK